MNMYPRRSVNWGDKGFIHPDLPNMVFGSKDSIIRDLHSAGQETPTVSLIREIDTTPTMGTVFHCIQPIASATFDEYFQPSVSSLDSKFPEQFDLLVYVMTGGSEGLYLHIDIQTCVSKPTIRRFAVGKTLDSSYKKWLDCWICAGQIAWELGV